MEQTKDTPSTNTGNNASNASNTGNTGNTGNAGTSVKPFPTSGQAAPASNAQAKPQDADSNAAAAAEAGVESLLKRVTQSAHDVVDGVAAKISSTVDGIQGSVGKAGDTRDEWVESAREAVRQHPFAALGTAVLVGLALRSLLSSRDR